MKPVDLKTGGKAGEMDKVPLAGSASGWGALIGNRPDGVSPEEDMRRPISGNMIYDPYRHLLPPPEIPRMRRAVLRERQSLHSLVSVFDFKAGDEIIPSHLVSTMCSAPASTPSSPH